MSSEVSLTHFLPLVILESIKAKIGLSGLEGERKCVSARVLNAGGRVRKSKREITLSQRSSSSETFITSIASMSTNHEVLNGAKN